MENGNELNTKHTHIPKYDVYNPQCRLMTLIAFKITLYIYKLKKVSTM